MSSIYHNHITDHTRTQEQTTQCVGWGKGRRVGKEKQQTRSGSMKFDRSKGHCKQFSQAAFGFQKSLVPSAKLRKGQQPYFSVVRDHDGMGCRGDEGACILRFWKHGASGLMKHGSHEAA